MANLVDLVFVEMNEDLTPKSAHKITCQDNNWLAQRKSNGFYVLQIGTEDKVLTFVNTTRPEVI